MGVWINTARYHNFPLRIDNFRSLRESAFMSKCNDLLSTYGNICS